MRKTFENILVVAGSGRNCGKTTFLCKLLQKLPIGEATAIKITPHFHETTKGLTTLDDQPGYKIFREGNRHSEKDSSRYLQAGAAESFYIQATDDFLSEAFSRCISFVDGNKPVVVESAALARYIHPALFLFIQKKDEIVKNSVKSILPLADEIVFSDGKSFSLSPEQIIFKETWKIKTQ